MKTTRHLTRTMFDIYKTVDEDDTRQGELHLKYFL